jgi:hypothetical protein
MNPRDSARANWREQHHLYRSGSSWLVAVKRRRRLWRRMFSIREYGEAGALARARAWRDALFERLPLVTPKAGRFRPVTTGIAGVQFVSIRRRSGELVTCYRATWRDLRGRQRSRDFSVLEYGRSRALALAADWRERMLKQVMRERRRLARAAPVRAAHLRHLNVRRVDGLGEHGWVLKLTRRGHSRSQYFADSRYGGKARALEAALRRRDELTAAMPPAVRIKMRFSLNKSGVIGVSLQENQGGHRYWVADWTELTGEHVRRRFSVTKLGEREARRRAVETRREAVKRILSAKGARPAWLRRARL